MSPIRKFVIGTRYFFFKNDNKKKRKNQIVSHCLLYNYSKCEYNSDIMRAKIKSIYRKSGKLSVMMLVFIILFTLTAPTATAALPFRDVPQGAWFYNSVVWAYTRNITSGTSNTTFSPNATVTRGQFITFLYRIEGTPPVDNTPRFNDVRPSQYYFRAVNWAAANGIVFGIGDGSNFAPGRHITREEMAVILFRYASFVGADLTSSASTFDSFPDRNTTSTWARVAMQWATHHGVIVGSNGRLLPRDDATRGQSVTILHRADRSGLLDGSLGVSTFNYINPLTGLGSARNISENRPVAVSIGNAEGMPTNASNGISQADIVYEFLVENGDTRLLALYQDFTDVGLVGSIRSARPYTLDIVDAYDALFLHAGATTSALEEIIRRNITNFNETQGPRWGMFSRNQHRIPGHTVHFYHSAVTSGPEATRWFPAYKVNLVHRNNNFGLSFTDNPVTSVGDRAHSVELRFSSHKTSTFTFNERQNRYHMSQFGSRFTDANNNASVAFTNLLILQMSVRALGEPRDIPERLAIDTVGEGTGYFVNNGRRVPINWSRENESSPFVYTLADGSNLELGRGKTYIGIIPAETYVGIITIDRGSVSFW